MSSRSHYGPDTWLAPTWVTAGALLVTATLVGLLDTPPGWTGGLNLLLNLVYASALILFAFGVRPAESVTARRPLGTAAIVLLACWSLGAVVGQLAGVGGPATAAEFSFGWVDVLVRFVLAVVAGTQIARIRVVPAPWHWAPLLAVVPRDVA